MSWRAAAAALLCACGGTTGTVTLDLTTAPDSHVLDAVQRLRLTVTQPRQVIEAARTTGGFDLALDLDASGTSGAVIVEGFDGAGALVACGQSPPFPVTGINAHISVYVAAPRSFAAAPVGLPAARSAVSGGSLGYGVVFAGGRDATGAPSGAVEIYNAYDHSLSEGSALPAPRAGVAVATTSAGGVYLFGGAGSDGQPTGTLWQFDTTAAPSGAYLATTDYAAFARTDQLMLPIDATRYVITGAPPLTLNATGVVANPDIAALPAAGAVTVASDGAPVVIFAGAQLVRFHQGAFDVLGTGRSGAAAARLPDGRVAVIGGDSHDALVVDPSTGAITTVVGALPTLRNHPAVAATSRHLVVAGGTDMSGAPIASADVLDAATLLPIATLPILPRSGAFAAALANDQVLLVGGAPASAQIELFTPEPPAL